MKVHRLEQRQFLPVSLDLAWSFFSTPTNLNEITPPDLGFRITSPPEPTMYPGQIITYRIRIAPCIWVPWVTEIKHVEPMRAFVDEQRFGPYAFWFHRHHFEAKDHGVMMTDVVHYALPFGPLGSIAHACFVRRKLNWIFSYRKQLLADRFGQ